MSDSIKDSHKGHQNVKAKGDSRTANQGKDIYKGHRSFLIKKSERLASALYVITGFIPSEEPLRTRLRTCALLILNKAVEVSMAGGVGLEAFTATCLEIKNILEIAHSAGLVSSMNARLIGDEYMSLSEFVRDHQDNIFDDRKVTENLSDIKNDLYIESPKLVSKRHPIQTTKEREVYKGHNERSESILNLLKDKDKISIKDAVSAIVGYSEKTIQRELLSLVASGVLIKEGERRWSTYRKA